MADAAPVNILLVEGNPRDAELSLRELGDRGHLANRVLWVKDGAEALDALFSQGPYGRLTAGWFALVLLELRLPKISGIEVLAAIRRDARTSSTPVVLMTSESGDPEVSRAEQLGVGAVLVKPVTVERFVEAVAAIGFGWGIIEEPLSQDEGALPIDQAVLLAAHYPT